MDPKQEVNSCEARRKNKTLLCAKRGEKNKILLYAKRGENFEEKKFEVRGRRRPELYCGWVEFDAAVLDRVIF